MVIGTSGFILRTYECSGTFPEDRSDDLRSVRKSFGRRFTGCLTIKIYRSEGSNLFIYLEFCTLRRYLTISSRREISVGSGDEPVYVSGGVSGDQGFI